MSVLFIAPISGAVVVLIRRDVMVEDWSDPLAGEFGVEASNRVWLGRFKK